ncbi:hypothetical protein GF371_03430 [Candidatus Woesearchaeota archaeon]|nr:hypothetical protein [Candidatus Woesearchaeota archaeon]
MADKNLFDKLATTPFDVEEGLSSITREQFSPDIGSLFGYAVENHVRNIIKGHPGIVYYDEQHPVFIKREDDTFFSERKTIHIGSKRIEMAFCLKYDQERKILFACHGFPDRPSSEFAQREIDLLFDFHGITIFGQVAYINPESSHRGKIDRSPLSFKKFMRQRANIQRALGKRVEYLAVVNRDFIPEIPERTRFKFEKEMKNTRIVQVRVTSADAVGFYKRALQDNPNLTLPKKHPLYKAVFS